MEQLSDLVKRRLGNHNLNESAKSAEVLYAANQWLNNAFELNDSEVRAHVFSEGELSIRVKSSVWSQELWGVREDLLKELQNRFGESAVKKIRIKSV